MDKKDEFIVVLIYIDDIVVIGNDLSCIKELKANMNKQFEINNIGNLKYFLSLEIMQSRKGIYIFQ